MKNKFYNTNYRSNDEVRAFAKAVGVRTRKDWELFCRSGLLPEDIPTNPDIIFGEPQKYRSFEEAVAFITSLGIETRGEWEDYCKTGNKPADIPFDLEQIYFNPFSSYYVKTDTKRTFNNVETEYLFCYHNFRTRETFSFEYLCERYPSFKEYYQDEYCDAPFITDKGEILERVDWLLDEDE